LPHEQYAMYENCLCKAIVIGLELICYFDLQYPCEIMDAFAFLDLDLERRNYDNFRFFRQSDKVDYDDM
jgi:hypothetical protein